MKNRFLFVLFCLIGNGAFTQNAKIDSLKGLLKDNPNLASNLKYSIYNNLGYEYSITNTDSSQVYIQKAYDIGIAVKKENWLIQPTISLGFMYYQKGFTFKAIEFNYKALRLAEKFKDSLQIEYCFRTLAEIYNDLHDYPKAITYAEKGLVFSNKLNYLHEQIACITIIGNANYEQKKYIEAEKNYKTALELAIKQNQDLLLAVCYQNMGIVLGKTKKNKDAINYLNKSESLFLKNEDFLSLSALYADKADFYLNENDIANSTKYAKLTEKYALKTQSMDVLSKSYKLMYENYSKKGNHHLALTSFEQYIKLKDSLNFEDNYKRINSLQLEYENANKNEQLANQKIEILQKENENFQVKNRLYLFAIGLSILALLSGLLFFNRKKLQKMNQTLEIKVAERTKDLVIANEDLIRKNEEIIQALHKGQTIERKRVAIELHDNLSSLLSALNMSLQAINPQSLNTGEQAVYSSIKDMMKSAYNEVRNISHNILPADLEKFGLKITLEKLIEKLNVAGIINFKFQTNLSELRLDPKIEFNLYSICLELVNNLIKHSEAKNALVDLQNIDNNVTLTVADDGIGLKETEGFGYSNIKSRIEALNGELLFQKLTNFSTVIKVIIPN